MDEVVEAITVAVDLRLDPEVLADAGLGGIHRLRHSTLEDRLGPARHLRSRGQHQWLDHEERQRAERCELLDSRGDNRGTDHGFLIS
jgi:hypothetical protein